MLSPTDIQRLVVQRSLGHRGVVGAGQAAALVAQRGARDAVSLGPWDHPARRTVFATSRLAHFLARAANGRLTPQNPAST